MIACLICPSEKTGVQLMAERAPLALMPLMGQTLLEYWMTHLAAAGCKRVLVLAHEQVDRIQNVCGTGKRWGLEIEVAAEPRPFTPAQALLKYGEQLSASDANNVWTVDHFPGVPESPLFESYSGFFAAMEAWIQRARTIDRVGIHEIRPGVFVDVQACVAPDAQLLAPCWVSRHSFVGARSVVGPGTSVESGAFIEPDTEVVRSYVGPGTFVGRFARISGSIAWENTLVDWQTGSAAFIPDRFLLCGLGPQPVHHDETWLSRFAELCSRNKTEAVMACKHLLMRKES